MTTTTLLLLALLPGRVLHVSPQGTDKGDGTPEHPMRAVEQAFAALVDGDTLKLAAGTYTVATRSMPLRVTGAKVTISGGFDASFSNRAPFDTPTLIQPAQGFDKPLIEIAEDANGAVVDGITLDAGAANTYGKNGLAESSLTRLMPLIRVLRAHDVVIR